jgi:hypothetical protein
MSNPNQLMKTLTQTLFANGYLLEEGRSVPGARLLTYSTPDRFGGRLRYLIGVPERAATAELVSSVRQMAKHQLSHPVILGELENNSDVPVLTFDEFIARFGGPVVSLLPLSDSYSDQIQTLATNRLPGGMSGTASNLFEDYVAAGIQFLFGTRVIAYGTKRTGEAVPDGIAFRRGGYVLYDAKAANSGYEATRDEYRKFKEYTLDFHRRYEASYGAAHVFLVISGSFTQSEDTLSEKSREFFAETKSTVLAFLTIDALLAGIQLVREDPRLREGVNWDKVLARPLVTSSVIANEIRKSARDGLQERV